MRKIPVIIDTREQRPLDFAPFPNVRVERRKAWPGDYTLKAYSRMLAIERKSVSDLVGTMCGGYAGLSATTPKRFDCELLGMGGVLHLGGRAFVLVEPDGHGQTAEEQIAAGNYRAMIPPEKVRRFIDTIRTGWKIPVIMASSREHAAEIVVAAVTAADVERLSWKPFDKWLPPPPGQVLPAAQKEQKHTAQGLENLLTNPK